ncbi:MAG: polysaccharide biosynthesis/export family protein [Alphaproteobacteria bacterium]|nr:polysaccharide biosynthesis/export family protein [Alphaproteobacteria bacterium]
MTPSAIRRVVLLIALAVLSGCSGIPRAGPGERAITDRSADLAGFTLIDMVAENVADYRVQASADGAGTAGVPAAPAVALSSGDVLRVRVSESKEGGLFAPLAAGGTLFDNVRVDHKGTISIPYAGRVKVAGLDPQRVEDRLRARLAGVTFEPQVYVELIADRGSSVLVSGEVKAPGRFSMIEGPMTLIDAVSRAGGSTKPAHQVDVIVRRGKSVKRMSLAKVQSGQNQQLRAGDEVILESNAKVFNALGAVKQSGQVEFSKSNPTLLDALAQVGGLDNTNSSNTGVFVFRLREPKAWVDADGNWQEGPVIFKFNMAKPETMFLAQAFGMKPDDTIYITNAPTVEWTRALQPIALTLATVRGSISVGSQLTNF